MSKFDPIISDVLDETARQKQIFKEQNHNNFKWDTILSEEKGKLSEAILESEPPDTILDNVKMELIHVAAVCFTWLDCIDRQEKTQKDKEVKEYLLALDVEKEIKGGA